MLTFGNLGARSGAIQLQANSALADRQPTASWTLQGTDQHNFNATPGPDGRNGASQAFQLIEGTLNEGRQVISPLTIAGSTALWLLRAYLKTWGPATRFASMFFWNGASNASDFGAVNLKTGEFSRSSGDGGSYVTTLNIVKRLPNGWFKLCHYATLAAENVQIGIEIGDTGPDAETATAYVGDGLSGMLIWGIDVRLASDAIG